MLSICDAWIPVANPKLTPREFVCDHFSRGVANLRIQYLSDSSSTEEAGELRIKPVRVTKQAESDWIKELYDLFAPVRKQARDQNEDEINTAIDDAVHAVRKGHV